MSKYTNLEISNALELLAYVCEDYICGDCPLTYDEGCCYEDWRCALEDSGKMKEVARRLKNL